ncbi:MAG TPA: hypothetical protein VKV36_09265 [Acidimicrobiales bacterium]|nr:hypothetical protein [Acidimicrobiales bacterium]
MTLELTDLEGEILASVIEGVLGDLSSEIAATENPSFRAELNGRRDVLRRIHGRLTAR